MVHATLILYFYTSVFLITSRRPGSWLVKQTWSWQPLQRVFPAVPFLPIGRTAGSLLGAMLMVVFQVMTPDHYRPPHPWPPLRYNGYKCLPWTFQHVQILGKLLAYKSRDGKDLLCRICLLSAISSALFINDTTCVVLTEFVLKVARQNNLPPWQFLLALALGANVVSSDLPWVVWFKCMHD